MVFNKNQTNNINKAQKLKQVNFSNPIINKKMGKERNFIVNRTSSNILEQGTDFSVIEYTYSRRTPKPDIINEILKRLKKFDSKLDVQGKEIKEITETQKVQGEKIDKIDERLAKLENKLDTVIILNNLKIE
ncbi:MAG: hypothetical protein LBF02_00470 [Mycoplasmataceae bacterium]|jgi:uncharacterized coiled-coil protein SlyX|nr:hypothetical protein [Mycoplasmataceae bacterium]